jgi:hypothetical protein
MESNKPPMTGAYKFIFIFSILMSILCLFGGIATQSKGSLGVLLWGYAAWLMYGRKNSSLVTLFQTLMWFEIIAGVVGILFMLTLGTSEMVGISIFAYAILIGIGATVSYFLLEFFKKQTSDPLNAKKSSSATDISNVNESKYWEQALDEFNSAERNKSLWAKSFSECEGDENKAKAKYLSIRFNELASINKSVPVNKELVQKSTEPKNKEGYGIFFGILLVVGLMTFLIFKLSGPNRFSSDDVYESKPVNTSKSSQSSGGWYPVFFDDLSMTKINAIVTEINKGNVASLSIQYDRNPDLAKWVAAQISGYTSMPSTLYQNSPPDDGNITYARNRVTVIVRTK